MVSQHIQNGYNGFWTLHSIHRLLKCTPSCMRHINQYWCTFWYDLTGPTTLRLGAKGIDSWWWINLVHDNWHTFIKNHFFFTKRIGASIDIWNVEWTLSKDSYQNIHKELQVHFMTNYRWVQMKVSSFFKINGASI